LYASHLLSGRPCPVGSGAISGGEVVLSTEVTGMIRSTKLRAARDLARLGLIQILRDGNNALRVIPLLSIIEKRE
jgi:hypothetical protein